MIKKIYAYTCIILTLAISYIPYLWYMILGLFNKDRQYHFLHRSTALWGRICVGFTKSNIEVIGAEKLPDGNVLYVGNHQSYYDIPLLLGHLPKYKAFVAKIELGLKW